MPRPAATQQLNQAAHALGDESFAGTVAHSTPGIGFGVKFSHLNEEQNRFLRHMVHAGVA